MSDFNVLLRSTNGPEYPALGQAALWRIIILTTATKRVAVLTVVIG